MGGGVSKIKVSIGNAYSETVWAIVKQETDRTNCFVPEGSNQAGNWYQRQRGFQRIGPGGCVTFDLSLTKNINQVYVSVGSDTGMQISDCLPKEAVTCNLIVTAEGTVTNARLNARWEDEDGVCHRPGARSAVGIPTNFGRPTANEEFLSSTNAMRNLRINLVQNLSKGEFTNNDEWRNTPIVHDLSDSRQ